jgi:hypothetical protein
MIEAQYLLLAYQYVPYIVDNNNPTSIINILNIEGWTVTIIGESESIDFNIIAKCFDNPPLRP